MSSVMPFAFKNVELYVVTINGNPWTHAKEVCKVLEYLRKTVNVIKDHCSRENYANKYDLSKRLAADHLLNWPSQSRKHEYYINEEGIREFVLKSKQPKAADFGGHLGINVYRHKYTSKEQDTLSCIIKAFNG